MRPALTSFGAAILLAVMLPGCEAKVTEISVVCRPPDQPTEPVRWTYTSKVDPSVVRRLPPAVDVTLHYDGAAPRAAPPITTYFYRLNGATLRVASSAKATIPPKGTFTYHVDTGGYVHALTTTGRGAADQVTLYIDVDGSHFHTLLSPATCQHSVDRHLDVAKTAKVPDLKDKRPLNIAAYDWIGISTMPTVVMRTEGHQVSTYAFFAAPIALTETKNETSVPDDVAKQAAQVGVTAATAIYTITGEPTPQAGKVSGEAKGG
jgi:hypothetical protein